MKTPTLDPDYTCPVVQGLGDVGIDFALTSLVIYYMALDEGNTF